LVPTVQLTYQSSSGSGVYPLALPSKCDLLHTY